MFRPSATLLSILYRFMLRKTEILLCYLRFKGLIKIQIFAKINFDYISRALASACKLILIF